MKNNFVKREVVYTLGGYYNGWLVEYLWNAEKQEALLAWRDPQGHIDSGGEIVINGKYYRPEPPSELTQRGIVQFPSALGPSVSTSALADTVEWFITSSFLLNSRIEARVISYYVLLTWMFDAFAAVPYLQFVGDAGVGKSELMKRIGLMCYRAISAGCVSPKIICSLINRYRGTLLLEEADFVVSKQKEDIVKLLNVGAIKSGSIIFPEKVFIDGKKENQELELQVFCPKIIVPTKEFWYPSIDSRSIIFKLENKAMGELAENDIPYVITDEMRDFSDGMRNQLLTWRLEQWHPEIKVDPSFYDLNVSSRLNQIMAPLMVIAQDDLGMQSELRSLAREIKNSKFGKSKGSKA